MEMPLTQWIILALGVGIGILTLTRLPGALKGRNVNMFLTHVMITIVVLLSVDPVYFGVDTALGGVNVANLISHVCIPLIFLFGGLQIAKSVGRPDLVRMIIGTPGILIAALSFAGLIATFVAIGVQPTSMGLNAHRDDPMVILYRFSTYVYCGWVGAWVAGPLLRDRTYQRQSKAHAYARISMGIAMGAIAILPLIQLAEFLAPRVARPAGDIVVYSAIALAVSSPATMFFVRMGRSLKAGRSGHSAVPARSTSRPAPGSVYGPSRGSSTSR